MSRPRKPRTEGPWPQRLRFLDLLEAKVQEFADEGLTRDGALKRVAKILGLKSTNSLENSYRYDFSRIPKRPTMEKAATYFGVPLWEIYGPPPMDDEDAEYRLCLEIARHVQGSADVDKLTRDEVLHLGRVALATAKAMLKH